MGLFKSIKKAFKQVTKEIDRGLDRRVGIDDPGLRALAIAAGGAALGAGAGSLATGGSLTSGAGLVTSGIAGGTTTTAVLGGAALGGALTLSALKDQAETFNTVTQPTFDPFAVDNSAVIGAQEALRKRLANKRGLSSTNVTGGVRSAASGTKPTLFTFA